MPITATSEVRYSEKVTMVSMLERTAGAVPGTAAGFSAEFRLLLLCLRWPLVPKNIHAVEQASEQVQDWQHFLAVVRRHRVAGMAARALRQAGVALPAAEAGALRHMASATAMQAMALSVESLRLSRLLAEGGTAALFLKGPALAVLAYGDVTVRHSKDVDVLVSHNAVERSISLLQAAGYQPAFDLHTIAPSRRALWFRYAKAMDWTHTATGAQLEVHWRLTDPSQLHQARDADRTQQVTLTNGQTLATLSPDALLAYLCVHGSMHGWMRLKWLADVYALLPNDASACEQTYRTLVRQEAGRAAGQALLLCHALFDLPLPPSLLQELRRSPILRYLQHSALRLLHRGGETAELEDLPFGTTSVYVSRLLLAGSPRQLLQELRTWGFRPDELLNSRLPRPLFFLFPLVRVAEWLRERLRHGGRSPHPRA